MPAPDEARAPADPFRREGERRGGHQRTDGADGNLQARQRGEPVRREPAAIDHQRPHEHGRAADAHQHAGQREPRFALRRGEDEAAQNGDADGGDHGDARAVPVEQDADGDLRDREGEEEGSRENAEVFWREAEIGGEIWRDDAGRRAQELLTV